MTILRRSLLRKPAIDSGKKLGVPNWAGHDVKTGTEEQAKFKEAIYNRYMRLAHDQPKTQEGFEKWAEKLAKSQAPEGKKVTEKTEKTQKLHTLTKENVPENTAFSDFNQKLQDLYNSRLQNGQLKEFDEELPKLLKEKPEGWVPTREIRNAALRERLTGDITE